MRSRNVPVRMTRCLVEVNTVMHAQLHFVECTGEIEINWRVVSRVPTKNDDHVHRAAMHLFHEIAKRDPVSRQRQNGRRRDGLRAVTERGIHLRYERV